MTVLELVCWSGIAAGVIIFVKAEALSRWTNGGAPTCCGWSPFCSCKEETEQK